MRKFKTITEYDLLEAAFDGLWHRQCDDNMRLVVFGDDGTRKQRIEERKKQMNEINGRMIEIEEEENTMSNEAKKIIQTIKRGELPELPDVDKQGTFGLQTIGDFKENAKVHR